MHFVDVKFSFFRAINMDLQERMNCVLKVSFHQKKILRHLLSIFLFFYRRLEFFMHSRLLEFNNSIAQIGKIFFLFFPQYFFICNLYPIISYFCYCHCVLSSVFFLRSEVRMKTDRKYPQEIL